MKTNNIKQQILINAYILLFTCNVESITIVELERKINRSRGTIFYYFKNKSELFKEVLNTLFFPTLYTCISSSKCIRPLDNVIQNINIYDSKVNAHKALINILIQGEKIDPYFTNKIKSIISEEHRKLGISNFDKHWVYDAGKLLLNAILSN